MPCTLPRVVGRLSMEGKWERYGVISVASQSQLCTKWRVIRSEVRQRLSTTRLHARRRDRTENGSLPNSFVDPEGISIS
jgi:hypothetical protein